MSNVHSIHPVDYPAELPIDLDPETGEALDASETALDVMSHDGVALLSRGDGADWLPAATAEPSVIARNILRSKEDEVRAKFEIGRQLAWARRDLGHGEFLSFLENQVGWLGQRTAYRYIQYAQAVHKNPLVKKIAQTGGIKKALLISQLPQEDQVELVGTEDLGDEELIELAQRPLAAIQAELKELREARDQAQEERRAAEARAEKAEQKLGAVAAAPEEHEARVLEELEELTAERDAVLTETSAFLRNCLGRWDEYSAETKIKLGQALSVWETHTTYHFEHFRQLSAGEGLDQHVFSQLEERAEELGTPIPQGARPVLVPFGD